MNHNKATNKIYHQECNLLVKLENKTNLGSKSETLPDPAVMLTIMKIEVTDEGQTSDVIHDPTAALDPEPHQARHHPAHKRHWHPHQQEGA